MSQFEALQSTSSQSLLSVLSVTGHRFLAQLERALVYE